MRTFKKNAATIAVLALLSAPVVASAETNTGLGLSADTQTQVQTLLTQIKALQEQIKNLVSSSTAGQGWKMGSSSDQWMNQGQMGKMTCITIGRNLKKGDQGDDVKSIQQMLKDDSSSGFNGSVTGFFGPLTMKAMRMFQMNNGISASADGSVGPLTRGFFERRCGKGLDNGGMGKMPGGSMMEVGIRGTISAATASSVTVNNDNGSLIVNVTASTTIKIFAGTSTPATAGTISDLTVGKNVMAQGSKNPDGSIQAMMIAVGDNLPMMKGGMMGEIKDIMQGVMDAMVGTEGHGGAKPPMGMMPTTNGPQHGPGLNGGPQNW